MFINSTVSNGGKRKCIKKVLYCIYLALSKIDYVTD